MLVHDDRCLNDSVTRRTDHDRAQIQRRTPWADALCRTRSCCECNACVELLIDLAGYPPCQLIKISSTHHPLNRPVRHVAHARFGIRDVCGPGALSCEIL